MSSKSIPVIGLTAILALAGTAIPAAAQGNQKNVNVITGVSPSNGKSNVGTRLLEECIEGLPGTGSLEAMVTSKPVFLKEINGETGKNGTVQVYTASLEINYMLLQKELVIVTTNSIASSEPLMKVMNKKIRKRKSFESDPAAGDLYAGRSRKQYYFSDRNRAIEDVKKRAAIWLKQQGAVVCK